MPESLALDVLIPSTRRQEALSRAYVSAVAGAAGYDIGTTVFDQEGVDLTVHASGAGRPRLDIQLKATINLGEPVDGSFRFALKARNYNLLRETVMVPRILVVYSMPREETEWLSASADELALRKCAYWADLAGMAESDNSGSVTVPIPVINCFDVDGLRALLARARRGSLT